MWRSRVYVCLSKNISSPTWYRTCQIAHLVLEAAAGCTESAPAVAVRFSGAGRATRERERDAIRHSVERSDR